MVTYGENVKEARSSERLTLQCSLIIANGIETGEGQILNLSKNGCLLESPISINAGDHLQLRIFLQDTDLSMCVSVAVVQWVQTPRFGVEFVKVDETHRARLDHFIALWKDPWKLAL
jgi:hypothetical protein